ncbi:MAG: hypothetical protein RIQ46_509 [Pseudomonadota bacterium]|jgi:hypothetical protein
MRTRLAVLIALSLPALSLSACAGKTELQPQAGEQLPPAPFGRDDQPTANRLLEPPVQVQPERSVELRKRSEERADDPFDLPPPE